MRDRVTALVPVLLLLQAAAVYCVSSVERPPDAPNLSSLPGRIGHWKQAYEEPVDPSIARELNADRLLSRVYSNGQGMYAALFIAWFRSQRDGASQPHSPKVCLPAAGWTVLSSDDVALDTPGGSVSVNRYMVVKGAGSSVVLYWYRCRAAPSPASGRQNFGPCSALCGTGAQILHWSGL